ncbi:hypothetical protein CL646_05425 [bacterium]|mgnify:FL=1|nr:hypothetical protein [bacterium]|tara:strand:+ start:112 stop:525 length:414 start_codon:yes stop_codon:yes gene_type:complete
MFISKSSRANFIDILEYLCRKTGISAFSLGVMIRSYHFAMPVAFIFILMFCDGMIVTLSVIYYALIVSLFILFDGCFISMLENRLCKDNFNMIDPFLEFNGLVVDYKSRKALTYYIAVCYTMLFLTIYYVRFRLKVE